VSGDGIIECMLQAHSRQWKATLDHATSSVPIT